MRSYQVFLLAYSAHYFNIYIYRDIAEFDKLLIKRITCFHTDTNHKFIIDVVITRLDIK